MKKSGLKILVSLLFVVYITACDTVEEPYIEGNPFSGEYDSDLAIRKILLEDFTGFGCINCPRASEEIHKLQERYGDHIVPIAIHSGWFATPFSAEDPDYTTTTGTELGGNGSDIPGFFEITAQPIGVINRIEYNGNSKVEYQEWSTKIVDLLSINKFADISITIENSYQSDTKLLNINLIAKAITNIDAKLSLSVYLIENKVIGRQRDGSKVIEDYEHNHMLRGSINGTWGNEVSSSVPFSEGDKIEKSYTYTLSNDWNANNCELVAFIYNTDTKEVLQAETASVIQK